VSEAAVAVSGASEARALTAESAKSAEKSRRGEAKGERRKEIILARCVNDT
jgi:hypothetical protein